MTRAQWNETLKKCAKDYHSKKGTKPRKKYSKKKKSNKSATIHRALSPPRRESTILFA